MEVKKGFVVGRVGFEYNDEIFTQGEDSGVTPLKVFSTRERAKAEVVARTIDQLRKMDRYDSLGCYGYSVDEVINDPHALVEILFPHLVDANIVEADDSVEAVVYNKLDDDMYSFFEEVTPIITKLSDYELAALVKTLAIKFFEVYEVEVE